MFMSQRIEIVKDDSSSNWVFRCDGWLLLAMMYKGVPENEKIMDYVEKELLDKIPSEVRIVKMEMDKNKPLFVSDDGEECSLFSKGDEDGVYFALMKDKKHVSAMGMSYLEVKCTLLSWINRKLETQVRDPMPFFDIFERHPELLLKDSEKYKNVIEKE